MSWNCNGCHNDFKQRPLCWSCRARVDAAAVRREAFEDGVEAFVTEWYALEAREGERPYGFEVAGIQRFLLDRAGAEVPPPDGGARASRSGMCRDCAHENCEHDEAEEKAEGGA